MREGKGCCFRGVSFIGGGVSCVVVGGNYVIAGATFHVFVG